MSLSSAVPAWFPVSRHDLLQTAGLRSCSAIASQTDSVLARRARQVQCHSASSWPSACPYNAFAAHRKIACLPPIHCRKWSLVICYHPCAAHGQSSEIEHNQERLDASYLGSNRGQMYSRYIFVTPIRHLCARRMF